MAESTRTCEGNSHDATVNLELESQIRRVRRQPLGGWEAVAFSSQALWSGGRSLPFAQSGLSGSAVHHGRQARKKSALHRSSRRPCDGPPRRPRAREGRRQRPNTLGCGENPSRVGHVCRAYREALSQPLARPESPRMAARWRPAVRLSLNSAGCIITRLR